MQVFRIGRTISTRMSKDDFRACTLPKDSGGCDNKIFRYYYNAIEVRQINALYCTQPLPPPPKKKWDKKSQSKIIWISSPCFLFSSSSFMVSSPPPGQKTPN